jgi:hypothetical protein
VRLWVDEPGGVGVRTSMAHGPLFPLKLPHQVTLTNTPLLHPPAKSLAERLPINVELLRNIDSLIHRCYIEV